ncbi:Transmembrane protein 151B [Larimichthys crocea]|uniref:Transmembrane protein 151B n=1 Tax=Larimichthys crocea TaxID=215358 RepID=A0A6G0IEY7_LARCR|nr:Transmembrane protein 151B [Larimichthys crocea]
MEWHIRCNRQLIPSYSEAMLVNQSTADSSSLQDTEYTSSSNCFLLDSSQAAQSYGALQSQHDCEQCSEPNGQALFHSHLSSDTSRFSLCRMYGSHHTVALWRSHSSNLTDPCCVDEQCCRSDSSQLALSDTPPTYRDARFFPVLIVHRAEGCSSEEGRELRHYYIRRGSNCVETAL